jgi:hypothetical protein
MPSWHDKENQMSHEEKDGIWTGTGVLWTMVAGVQRSSSPSP